MKSPILFALILIVIGGLIIGCNGGSTSTNTQAEINSIFDQYATAYKAKDINTIVNFHTDPSIFPNDTYTHSQLQSMFPALWTMQGDIQTFEFIERQITIVDSTHATADVKQHTVCSLQPEATNHLKITLIKSDSWKVSKVENI